MIDTLKQEIDQIRDAAQADLSQAATSDACEELRIKYLGRNGLVTPLMQKMKEIPNEQKAEAGKLLNGLKQFVESEIEQTGERLKQAEQDVRLHQEAVDVTLPGRPLPLGRLHPITQTLLELYDIFAEMGFQVYQTREVETDEMNFQLLNLPEDHPARDMHDTFYTKNDGVVLRTHTSPGQIRVMRDQCPEPVRAVLPGKCYRFEQTDASHEWMFYQLEGIAIGDNITLADLKGTLTAFIHRMFGKDRDVQFRCSYFPFTEPSMEVAMSDKDGGWLEILGSGMMHPIVLHNGGYDPEKVSGFAFGMGVERIAMLKYGIDDIRQFYSNDLRFLSQF